MIESSFTISPFVSIFLLFSQPYTIWLYGKYTKMLVDEKDAVNSICHHHCAADVLLFWIIVLFVTRRQWSEEKIFMIMKSYCYSTEVYSLTAPQDVENGWQKWKAFTSWSFIHKKLIFSFHLLYTRKVTFFFSFLFMVFFIFSQVIIWKWLDIFCCWNCFVICKLTPFLKTVF